MVRIDRVLRVICLTSVQSYLFDIFLGPSYNQSPPSVKYMTVSAGVAAVWSCYLTPSFSDERWQIPFQPQPLRGKFR